MTRINPFLMLALTIVFLLASCKKDELPSVFKGKLSYEANPSNIRNNCSSLFFVSKTVGYATTEEGSVYKTTDGGGRWVRLNISSPVSLSGLCFVNRDIGYVFGGKSGCSPSPCEPYGSIAYKTSDGGKTWQMQNIPYKWSELYSAYFVNESVGFVVGKGLCIKTSNGGKTWQEFKISDKNVASKVTFPGKSTGYALNMGGLFKTNNLGLSWEDISVNGEKLTTNFFFINDTLGFANVSNKLFKTKDGGVNWILLDTVESSINFIYFVNEEIGITLSKKYLQSYGDFSGPPWRHFLRITDDGGQSWTTRQFEDQELGASLFAIDNVIFSLGYDKIFKLVIE